MPHSMEADEVLKELGSSAGGLTEQEAERRLKEYGYNEFGRGKKRGILELLIWQFKNYVLILLIIAALVAQAIGHTTDAFAIWIVVVLNVLFGFALEYSADRSMEELKKLAETKALVMRGWKKDLIDSRLLVPGDIIYLEEGAAVPADARLLEEHNLEMNEAPLTGESMLVRKNVGRVAEGAPLAERSSMVYAGTFVAKGSGNAVVVATGMRTEFGGIEKSLSEVGEAQTTLEKNLAELGKAITMGALLVVCVLFLLGIGFGKWNVEELFIYSVSVIVAAVPEGMLTIFTIILAIGVKNMAGEKAVVRKLQAVETLGNISFVATDKTGTITEGRMALVKAYDGTMRDFAELSGTEKLLSYSYLCNSAHLTEDGVVGDETDRALLIAGIAKGVNLRVFMKAARPVSFTPFDYGKKMMSGVYEVGKQKVAIVKGAPESVLAMCSEFEGRGRMDARKRKGVAEELHALAREGMRVIAVAYGKPVRGKVPEKGLTFLGLLALHDPVRREVKDTIAICNKAGIRVMMVTGDNLETARKIAHEIGLNERQKAVLWSGLENLDEEGLRKALVDVSVVARATPASKLRIVELLVKQGEIVAVTGDGVNDAPALKKAHVGVVMGRTGTAVSKEVADLVLMDDNFATLEKAIEYGRGITDNIMKFLRFQITTNIALVYLSIPFVLGLKMLEPVHILWINLIIDGPPGLTLGLEKPQKEVMREKPRKAASFVDVPFLLDSLNSAAYMAALSMVLYLYYVKSAPEKAITMVFCTFALMQLFNALNSRSRTERFYSGLWDNKWLVLSILAVAAIQLMIVLLEPLRIVFSTVQLNMGDFIIMLAASGSVLVAGEARKMLIRK